MNRAAFVAHLVFVCISASAQVVLRGGVEPPPGGIVEVNDQGVRVGESMNESVLITWDRVMRVEGDRAADAIVYEWVMDAGWRARTRLERGDPVGAEPLFTRLFNEYRERPGPLSARVCDGLLECRLRRDARVGAVEAWLVLVAQGAADKRWYAYETYRGAPASLVPGLPPIWLDSAAARAFAASPFPFAPGEGGALAEATELAELYRHAAAHACGLDSTLPEQSVRTPELRFVRDMVLAQTGDTPETRGSARARLAEEIGRAQEPWVESWARVAIARSLAREPDDESRLLAVVQYLHLPARIGRAQPYLTGLALGEAADLLDDAGDHAGAAVLRQELTLGFPDHPAALGHQTTPDNDEMSMRNQP